MASCYSDRMARIALIVLVGLAWLFFDGRMHHGNGEVIGLGVRGRGEAIEPIRTLTADEQAALHTDAADLGFYYRAHGLGDLDIYRSDGAFVTYRRGGGAVTASNTTTVATYTELDQAELEAVGDPSTPWRYRITPGLLLLIAFAELGYAVTRKVTQRFALGVAVTALGVAAVLGLAGLQIEAIIPLALGTIHALGYAAARTSQAGDQDEEEARPQAPSTVRPMDRAPAPSSQGRTDLGPFRSAPTPQLAIERPVTPSAAKAAPIAHDESAPPPTILR